MIKLDGSRFRDSEGRTLMLRGVNLGGSSKVPVRPDGATHIKEGFYKHRNVSFVGRPFPLKDADEHFRRLRSWGFTFIRMLVTWEAIEHEGPGVYDEEYLDYIYQVVKKAGDYGISLFIDPHQDVWSRWTGGDGAPAWTLEAVGFDLQCLHETSAAFTHQESGDPYPRMIWPTNTSRLACATMFTLFFGGNDFAPETLIDGQPVQEYLQGHYIKAIQQVAMRLKGLSHVIGYDSLNEPSSGYISCESLNTADPVVEMGVVTSPFQSMVIGSGIPLEAGIWKRDILGPRMTEKRIINPGKKRAWRKGHDCIWRKNGVWGLDIDGRPNVLRPDHFSRVRGKKVDFARDYLRPFVNRFAREIRSVDPGAVIFMETEPDTIAPVWGKRDARNVVHAPHWYDTSVLFLKMYNSQIGYDVWKRKPVLGKRNIRRSFKKQLSEFKRQSEENLGGVPTLIGEVGIAYDLNRGAAYSTGNFRAQEKAMDRSMRALEDNMLSFTLWNYTADNINERGDLWNGEDLSIFSRDQQEDPGDINSGGRALRAVVRPYPVRTAGEPLELSFNMKNGDFLFRFRHDPGVDAPTEIFVPDYQYPRGYHVTISDGFYWTDKSDQIIVYRHSVEKEDHEVRISGN